MPWPSLRCFASLLVLSVHLSACPQKRVVEGFPDKFAGVGMELKIVRGRPLVVRPLKGGPSAAAGIQKGDRLMEIDGDSTEGMTLGKVVMALRGRPNSQVTLVVDRKGKRIVFVVRRQKMKKHKGEYKAEK